MQQILVNNSEYNLLYNSGGDSLVAFFATLRANKKDTVFKKKGKRGCHSTLRYYTNLSLNTIKKYLPKLIELNLCEVHLNGNIGLNSRSFNRRMINDGLNNKLIPIIVYSKFSKTKSSSYFVRIHSNIEQQEKGISKKREQIQLFNKHENDTISHKELKALKRLKRRGLYQKKLSKDYRSNTTLANSTFSTLKSNHQNKKSSGNYHKSILIKLGLIKQKREYKIFRKGVFSRSDVLYLRNELMINGLFLTPNGIVQEISPHISVC